MAFPYQCLVARLESNGNASGWTLFGTSGPRLVAQSDKGVNSIWPEHDSHDRNQADDNAEAEGPPGKRIKLEQQKEQKSNFTNLILSHEGQYVVGVTGEDKCVRVFSIDAQGKLRQLSERCMSRRPSSITLTPDDSTILCADKFGDVYALPLLPSPDEEYVDVPETEVLETKEKEWIPSATTLTVHSGRNRRTLEEQLKQKAKGPAKSKEPMRFKHELLLGHVSMLTDVIHAQHGSRGYIITADRDEHIRVSRGLPQAHIIEGFCLGHSSFISRLCLTRSGLLVSGGGDDDIFVWDWQNYRLAAQVPLLPLVAEFASGLMDSRQQIPQRDFKLAVSGIWNSSAHDDTTEIIVACEGVPALFELKIGGQDDGGVCIPLKGNALDVAMIRMSPTLSTLAVSIDNVHVPSSTTELRSGHTTSPLQYFSKRGAGSWEEDLEMHKTLSWFELQGSKLSGAQTLTGSAPENSSIQTSTESKTLKEILYSMENLRKRPGAED